MRMTDAEATARLRARSLWDISGWTAIPDWCPRGSKEAKENENDKTRSCWTSGSRGITSARSRTTLKREVVALDLAPRTPRVFRCDFLELAITPEGSEMQTSVEKTLEESTLEDASSPFGTRQENPSPFVTTLRSYRRRPRAAVVMSLVLSYLPCPRMRGEMVRRAREVLLDDGRGVLLIVTPHSTDRSYSGAAERTLAVWRETSSASGLSAWRTSAKRACTASRSAPSAGAGRGEDGGGAAASHRARAKERETQVQKVV